MDVDNFTAKPKPVLVRLLQNPNFHLGLIAVLGALLIAYIVHSSSRFMSHETNPVVDGQPLTSRDAAIPESRRASPPRQAMTHKVEKPATPPVAEAPAIVAAKAKSKTEPKTVVPKVKRMQLSFWEVPRNLLVNLITEAEKINESNEGRVYLLNGPKKVMEELEHSSRRVALDRNSPLTDGARLVVETPPNASEAFQFGFMVQLTQMKTDPQNGATVTVKLDSTLVSAVPDAGANTSSNLPTMRPLVQSSIAGTASLTPQKLLLIVIVPNNRTPATADLAKAGAGPWSIFTSQAFRAAVTDWAMVLRLD